MGQYLLSVPYESAATESEPESLAGAHVARMILNSLNATGLPNAQGIYEHAQQHQTPGENWPGWYIDPGAMHHTLADYDPRPPGGFPGHWVIYTNTGQPGADNQIRFTLDNYKVAAAVLVNGGKHWVCVTGYTFDDQSKALTGFYYHDSAYVGGGANVGISLSLWDSAYTQVSGGVKWLGKIVEVGDPNPAAEMPPVAQRRIQRPGDAIIGPEEATRLGIEGALASFGEMPHLREALREGRPGRARLVARLDRRGTYYYLVPVNAADDREDGTLAVIMVDALYGDVLSVSAAERPYPLWRVGRDEVRERVTRRPIPVYEPLGAAADRLVEAISERRCGHAYGAGATTREPEQALVAPQRSLRETAMAAIGSYASPSDYVLLRPGEFEIGEMLAWDPCGGSSPFHPYHVVRTAWQHIYVNAYDGAVLAQLDLCPWGRLGA
jgi:hypothetical protein